MRASVFVGRVGALALALGVGVGVSLACGGVAWAAPQDGSADAAASADAAGGGAVQRSREGRGAPARSGAVVSGRAGVAETGGPQARPGGDQRGGERGVPPARVSNDAPPRQVSVALEAPAVPVAGGVGRRAAGVVSVPGVSVPAGGAAVSGSGAVVPAVITAEAPTAVAVAGVVESAVVPSGDGQPAVPVQSPVSWMVIAAARRREGQSQPAVAAAVPAAAGVRVSLPVVDTYGSAAPMVYVAVEGTLNSIRTSTNGVVVAGPVSYVPVLAAISPDGKRVYVAAERGGAWCSTGSYCSVLDVTETQGGRTDWINLSTNARRDFATGLAVSPDGARVYVSTLDKNIQVINPVAKTSTAIPLSFFPGKLTISPDGKRAYVANGDSSEVDTIRVIDLSNPAAPIVTIPTGQDSQTTQLALSPDGLTLYAAGRNPQITVIDTDSAKVVDTLEARAYVPRLAVSPDGARLYATSAASYGRFLSVFDTALKGSAALIGEHLEGVGGGPVAVSPDGFSVWISGDLQAEKINPFTVPAITGYETVPLKGQPTTNPPIVIGPFPGRTVNFSNTATCETCNDAPVRGSVLGYKSLATDFGTGVITAKVDAVDPNADVMNYQAYHIGLNGYDVTQTGSLYQFTTTRGGLVTVNQKTGEFTYQPSAAARELAGSAVATARDKVDTFGVWAYDREGLGTGGQTVIPVTVPIVAASAAPVVSVANVSVAEGNSGSSNAVFTVSLSRAAATPVTVRWATANGTAAAGSDYTAGSGTVTFAAGVVSQTVAVSVTGDSAVESDETFTVTLSAPSGATLGTATATATITNDDTAPSPASGTITVGRAPVAVALATTAAGPRAYVVNESDGTVSVVNTSKPSALTAVATIPVGLSPQGVAVLPNGKFAYVSNSSSDSVSVIDTATNKVVKTLAVGGTPEGVAITPDGKFAYVTNGGISGRLSVIDTATNTVTPTTIAVGRSPWGVAAVTTLLGAARVYVANYNDFTVSVVDPAANKVLGTPISVGFKPRSVVAGPAGVVLVISENGDKVALIDSRTNALVGQTVAVTPALPQGFAFTSDLASVYITSTATNTLAVATTASVLPGISVL